MKNQTMKAVYWTGERDVNRAFQQRDTQAPIPKEGEVLIEVEAFGLNFAEIVARRGLYQDAPQPPSILGYDVVGKVLHAKNKNIVGKRVIALTKFGGYATLACADERTCSIVPDSLPADEALALSLQYVTAWILCHELAIPKKENIALVHSACGGVGIALTQLLNLQGCTIIALTSTKEKCAFALKNGASASFSYKDKDYKTLIPKFTKKPCVDLIFNGSMETNFKKDIEMLSYGGKFLGYGISSIQKKMSMIPLAFRLGFFNLIPLFVNSRSLIFLNLLRLAQHNPSIVEKSVQNIQKLFSEKKIKPVGAGIYPISKLNEAHTLLESRKTIGKIAITW